MRKEYFPSIRWAVETLIQRFRPNQKVNGNSILSCEFKHVLEKAEPTRGYLSNGALIAAVLLLGEYFPWEPALRFGIFETHNIFIGVNQWDIRDFQRSIYGEDWGRSHVRSKYC
jgi:hypothetical protein